MRGSDFYTKSKGESEKDYELYLETTKLLSCQKSEEDCCNEDELQFQIVHQVEELWMKLIVFTLVDIVKNIKIQRTNKVLTLFERVRQLLGLMTDQLSVLETMSPFDYQTIRLQLGNGSGQESPGFSAILRLQVKVYDAFEDAYLKSENKSIESIYFHDYTHCDAYMLAEALLEFDQGFQSFRYRHIKLIHRSIGISINSLKGRSVDILNKGMKSSFYPQLWAIRAQMTENWGKRHGFKRESIADPQTDKGEERHADDFIS